MRWNFDHSEARYFSCTLHYRWTDFSATWRLLFFNEEHYLVVKNSISQLAWNITASNAVDGSIDINIDYKVIHESYDPKFITNDISMLRLASIVNITTTIRPVCLPISDALVNRDYTGTSPWVAGWGSTSFRGAGSAILQVSNRNLNVILPFLQFAILHFLLCNITFYFTGSAVTCRVNLRMRVQLPTLLPQSSF